MIGIISFIAFTAIVAIFAYVSTRKIEEDTSDGYFLGGRSLGAITIAGSLLLTNLSKNLQWFVAVQNNKIKNTNLTLRILMMKKTKLMEDLQSL